MHLLIPFAAPFSEAGRQRLSALALPNLKALLGRMAEVERDAGDEWSGSTPQERALARALGWRGGDGRWPWAARLARADGIEPGKQAWGLLTPTHWHLGTEQVSLLDPAELGLDEAASRALFDAVRGLFTSEGFALHYGAPLRWYVAHDSLASLATASLDRVIGRNVDAWLGKSPSAGLIRRLQSEVQMRLHGHPLNEARVAAGRLPVNSFWLSGCGVAQEEAGPAPQVDERLRAPALNEDWAAWGQAWQALDGGPLAQALAAARRGETLRLTLCGERAWAAFEPAPTGLLHRLRARWAAPGILPLLEAL
ncbi:MAG: hypothetical protein Q8K96_16845 [Rubrivivax sp.]|nr:hypothetical protein [Rubrivivax sp.]